MKEQPTHHYTTHKRVCPPAAPLGRGGEPTSLSSSDRITGEETCPNNTPPASTQHVYDGPHPIHYR
eukprot:3129721-Prorocentrum_lima.AAC.1